MTDITVIGTGNMGQAIAGLAVRGGATVQLLGRDAEKTAAAASAAGATPGAVGDDLDGEIVVLAVPYPALAELALSYNGRLSGKVVVDISNPVNFETFDGLVVPGDSSAAAQLAAVLPKSRVLKAFNTNFAATLAAGTLGGVTAAVQIAGDDEEAKKKLVALVDAAGLTALDVGSLKRARELEAFGFLQLGLAVGEKIGWDGGFAVIR